MNKLNKEINFIRKIQQQKIDNLLKKLKEEQLKEQKRKRFTLFPQQRRGF